MPFIGNQPALSYTSFAKQDFTTSATTAYTLDQPVANANELALFINFVRQEPTTAYTASGTSLTLTSATSASDDMYCVFLGKAVQTVNPPNGSVDSSKINYPLTTFSSTGIDDNATSTALTIDSSGKLGIGTSSIDSNASVQIENGESYLVMKDAQQMGIKLYGDDTNVIYSYDKTADSLKGGITWSHSDATTIFYTGNFNERMRINQNGNIQIGTTTESARLHIASSTTAGTDPLVVFSDASGTDCGSIDINATANTVAYTTSSDYRLKENVSYDFDATTRLKQLRPARFNFIADANTTVDGFLAHEVSSVVPEAISGEKDATETKEKVVVNANGNVIAENIEQVDWEAGKIVDENGNTQYPTDSTWEATKVVPVYQGIDQSKLVPLLVKTIQELEARITALETQP